MGVNITIEGSTTPAAGVLKRGQRRTVALTDRIQRLLDRGFVVEISRTQTDGFDFRKPGTEDLVEESEKDKPQTWQPTSPSTNASVRTWTRFLSKLNPPAEVPEDADLVQLREIWQDWQQEHGGDS